MDTAQVVELIERASNAQPFCTCGAHTVAVAAPNAIRLTCASLAERPGGARRWLTLDLPVLHINQPILEFAA